MNLFNNPERNLFTFEKEQNNLTYVKFGKCNKVSALADVNNSEGGKLGEINSVIGDFDNSNIKFVVFRFNKELGLGEKNYLIPWKNILTPDEGNLIFTTANLNVLKEAPAFHGNTWPSNIDGFMDEVSEYWKNN
jgi:sporulation protein YlmC with PRC-barrel domain